MSALTAAQRAAAAGLELTVLRRLDGLLQGDHGGLLPGHGSETGEARLYAAGDDTRRIDWSLTARTTQPYVRDTIADHELELWLLVDDSASLAFGTARCEKPARSGRKHVGAILAALRRPPEDGASADLAKALTTLRRHARRRGLVVVVSDFLVPDGWDHPLRALASRHDVVAVEVLDPRELTLPDVGSLTVADPETGRRRIVDTGDATLRVRYAAGRSTTLWLA